MAKKVTQENLLELLAKKLTETRKPAPNELVVGIRNITGQPVGIPGDPRNNIPDINLSPSLGRSDPNSVAVIPYWRWQSLRRGGYYAKALIERDDSILGDVDVVAPLDRPEDLPPEHEVNRVVNPDEWIERYNETEIRERIGQMTSEPNLRFLFHAVDTKIREAQKGIDLKNDTRGVARAVASLPMKYRLVESLVVDRLDELNPIANDIAEEIDLPDPKLLRWGRGN